MLLISISTLIIKLPETLNNGVGKETLGLTKVKMERAGVQRATA